MNDESRKAIFELLASYFRLMADGVENAIQACELNPELARMMAFQLGQVEHGMDGVIDPQLDTMFRFFASRSAANRLSDATERMEQLEAKYRAEDEKDDEVDEDSPFAAQVDQMLAEVLRHFDDEESN